MSILNSLERRFGKYAIPNLAYYLLGGQVFTFVLSYLQPSYPDRLTLQGNLVLQGQWWRVFSFMIIPFSSSPLWVVFLWYLYYLYGTALEKELGSFRYLVYLLVAYVATVTTAFLFPNTVLGNTPIFTSLFLAFAYLFPNFQLLLFFILPVKVKWLAWLAWIGLVIGFIFGTLSSKVICVISVANFILFFGYEIGTNFLFHTKQTSRSAGKFLEEKKTYLSCAVCHKTEKDRKIFYHCSDCVPETCYCEDHINNHQHIKTPR